MALWHLMMSYVASEYNIIIVRAEGQRFRTSTVASQFMSFFVHMNLYYNTWNLPYLLLFHLQLLICPFVFKNLIQLGKEIHYQDECNCTT
jgi:hypothetical protein